MPIAKEEMRIDLAGEEMKDSMSISMGTRLSLGTGCSIDFTWFVVMMWLEHLFSGLCLSS